MIIDQLYEEISSYQYLQSDLQSDLPVNRTLQASSVVVRTWAITLHRRTDEIPLFSSLPERKARMISVSLVGKYTHEGCVMTIYRNNPCLVISDTDGPMLPNHLT